ncbi:MAG: hypothetical protein Q8R53_05285 [Nanoarchaeota archaeon]|nr:hypothetical protein [Nanoarchaeota archaeon]
MRGLRRFAIFLLFVTIFAASVLADFEITEIVYRPSDKEYVEVFTGSYQNLSGFLLADLALRNKTKDNLTEFQVRQSAYALIIADGFNFTGFNATPFSSSIYTVKAGIGAGLNDGGDSVFLFFPNESLAAEMNYMNSIGANGDGNSLQLINGTWRAAPPTPGLQNQAPKEVPPPPPPAENIVLSRQVSDLLYTNVSYTNLFHIEIEQKSCSEKDNVTIAYTIRDAEGALAKNTTFTKEVGCNTGAATGSFTPPSAGNFTLCGEVVESTVPEENFADNALCFSLAVLDPATISCDVGLTLAIENNLFFDEGESIRFTPLSNTTFPFRIEYWIEDLFGRVVKPKVTTTNSNQKSWTAQSPEQDRVYFLKAQLYPACRDQNLSDNAAEKMLIVLQDSLSLTNEASADKPSSITITEITPAEPRFGDLLQVKLDITKGTTSKYAVSLWAESKGRKISAETKIHLREEDTGYSLTLPVQLLPKCTSDPQDATLVIEGLGVRAEKLFTVDEEDGTFCSEEDSASNAAIEERGTSADSSPDFSFRLLDLPPSPTAGELLPISIFLQGDAEPHAYEAWSYLYRGSKCYSCRDNTVSREQLLQSGTLEPFEEKILVFQLPVDKEMEDGDYSLKVKLRKDAQKTVKELTETVRIEASLPLEKGNTNAGESATSSFTGNSFQEISSDSSGVIVYESNTAKAQALTPIVLLVTIGLLALVLLRK